jgi:hypothetical protein
MDVSSTTHKYIKKKKPAATHVTGGFAPFLTPDLDAYGAAAMNTIGGRQQSPLPAVDTSNRLFQFPPPPPIDWEAAADDYTSRLSSSPGPWRGGSSTPSSLTN